MQKITIFLSHSHLDIEKVRQLRNILEALGFEPLLFFLRCMDEQEELEEIVKREIDARDVFLYCKSKHATESKWVQKEIEYIRAKPYKRIFEINLDEAFETETVTFLASLADMVFKNTLFILSDTSVWEQAEVLNRFFQRKEFRSHLLQPFDKAYPSLDKLQVWEFQKYTNWLDNYLPEYIHSNQLGMHARNGIFIYLYEDGKEASSWNTVAFEKIKILIKSNYGVDIQSLRIGVWNGEKLCSGISGFHISVHPTDTELNIILNDLSVLP